MGWTDAEAKQFRGSFRGDAGTPFGSLSLLKPGMGLWPYIQADQEVTRTRPLFPQSGLTSLEEGWNLVAWAGHDGVAAEDAFRSLGTALSLGATWEARSRQLLHYSAGAPGRAGAPQEIQRGASIWVKATHARHWLQPGSTQVTVEATGDVSHEAQRVAAGEAQALVVHFTECYGLLAPGAVFPLAGHIASLDEFYYRGTVHIKEPRPRVIRHEYSHALQDFLVEMVDTSPAWIREGVANRWSALYCDATGERPYYVHIRETVLPSAKRTPIPLEAMEASLILEDYAGPNYSVAHLAIDWHDKGSAARGDALA